jgi:hypothetical protein
MERRSVEGTDFSLEHQTEATGGRDEYCIVRSGKVANAYATRDEAMEEYRRLCVAHWNDRLENGTDPERLAAAQALVRQPGNHVLAMQVLKELGTEADQPGATPPNRRRAAAQRGAWPQRRTASTS